MNRRIESNGRQRIYDALCKFGKDRPVEKVTVQKIIAEAEINRSTFYYYFDGVTDALEQMMTDFLGEYLQLFDIPQGETDVLLEKDFLLEQEKNICSLIQRRKKYLDVFLNPYNQKNFRQRFWNAFQEYAQTYDLVFVNQTGVHSIKRGIAYDYCLRVNFAMWFELLSFWRERDFHETAEDFVEIFNTMYNGAIGFENSKPRQTQGSMAQ